jgi:hypothetical protein
MNFDQIPAFVEVAETVEMKFAKIDQFPGRPQRPTKIAHREPVGIFPEFFLPIPEYAGRPAFA